MSEQEPEKAGKSDVTRSINRRIKSSRDKAGSHDSWLYFNVGSITAFGGFAVHDAFKTHPDITGLSIDVAVVAFSLGSAVFNAARAKRESEHALALELALVSHELATNSVLYDASIDS